MTINLNTVLKKQKTERYSSFIIYGDAGIGKSDYILKFIERNRDLQIAYFNILDEYPKLKSRQPLFDFNPKKFITWSLSLIDGISQKNCDALFIDNFDFILNLWSTIEKEEFLNQVEKYFEKSITEVSVIFLLHFDPLVENQLDKKFIIRFSELETQNVY